MDAQANTKRAQTSWTHAMRRPTQNKLRLVQHMLCTVDCTTFEEVLLEQQSQGEGGRGNAN
eukprot:1158914-Pelagomonas_calceolata.AAC.5